MRTLFKILIIPVLMPGRLPAQSEPGNDWAELREKFSGRYENAGNSVPDPVDSWYHVRIVVNYPNVKDYIHYASE